MSGGSQGFWPFSRCRWQAAKFAAFFVSLSIHAGIDPLWTFLGSSNQYEFVRTASWDADRNVLLTGGVNDANKIKAWALKLNPLGKLIWKTNLGNLDSWKDAVDHAGNLVFLGIVREQPESVVLSKLSAAGEVLWSIRYGNTTSDNAAFSARDFALDEKGNLYVAGTAGGSWTTVKYDRNGIEQWTRHDGSQASPSWEGPQGIVTVGDQKIAVCGVQNGESSCVIYNDRGDEENSFNFSAGIPLTRSMMKADAAGDLYIAGGTGTGMCLLKCDSQGKVLWIAKSTPSKYRQDFISFDLDVHGRAVLCASAYRQDFEDDILLAAFDPAGHELWSEFVDGGGRSGDVPQLARWQEDGSVLVIGSGLTADLHYEAILLRLDQQGSITDFVRDGTSFPRGGNSDPQGNTLLFGDGSPFSVSRYTIGTNSNRPRILVPPRPISVTESNIVRFSVTAEGAELLRYQWRFNGNNLPGETNRILDLGKASFERDGLYSVEISNELGWARSAESRLRVNIPPVVAINSLFPRIVTIGNFVSMAAGVGRGTSPLTYQWRFNGEPLIGQTNSILVQTNIQPDQAGIYEVFVSNEAGSGSATQVLSVSAAMPRSWSVSKELFGDAIEIVTGRNGNVFVGGTLFTPDSTQALVAMYSAEGTEIWTKSAPGYGQSVKLDASGNLYLATRRPLNLLKFNSAGKQLWSYSRSAPDYGGPFLALSSGDDCYFGASDYSTSNTPAFVVSRFDPDGAVRWQTLLGTAEQPAFISAMEAVQESGVTVAGRVGTNAFVARVAKDGRIVWQDTLEGTRSAAFWRLAIAPDDGLVVEGSDQGLSYDAKVILARYDSAGQRLWLRSYPQESTFGLLGVKTDQQTNIVAIWGSVGVFTVTKLDSAGRELWTTKLEGSIFNGRFCLDAANNILFAGNNSSDGYAGDYRLLKVDSRGRILSFTSSSLANISVRSVALDDGGTFYVAGGSRFNVTAYRAPDIPTQLGLSLYSPGKKIPLALELSGDVAFSYTVEESGDLQQWIARTNIVNLTGKVTLNEAGSQPARFYRAVKNP